MSYALLVSRIARLEAYLRAAKASHSETLSHMAAEIAQIRADLAAADEARERAEGELAEHLGGCLHSDAWLYLQKQGFTAGFPTLLEAVERVVAELAEARRELGEARKVVQTANRLNQLQIENTLYSREHIADAWRELRVALTAALAARQEAPHAG